MLLPEPERPLTMIRRMSLPVLYVYHDLIKRFGSGSAAQAVAYVGTVEHGGDLPEQFEMFFGRGLRYQQDEEQVDRRAVQRVEVHGSIQVQHGADGALAARQAAVRNGDAIAEAGGAEFSRATRFSKMVWASNSGSSLATRLAICSSTRFLLPPGTFTRERPGSGLLSRIIGEGDQRAPTPCCRSRYFSLCLIS